MTVYDYAHIGHARAYVAFDVLYRYLSSPARSASSDDAAEGLGRGFGPVTYVRNFTDVDDKIIARALASGEDPLALAHRFANEFHTVRLRARA